MAVPLSPPRFVLLDAHTARPGAGFHAPSGRDNANAATLRQLWHKDPGCCGVDNEAPACGPHGTTDTRRPVSGECARGRCLTPKPSCDQPK
jgi:hypothetical protein